MNLHLILRPAALSGLAAVLLLLLCMLLIGCQPKPSFAGTYVSVKATANGMVNDTLLIDSKYSIERRTGFTWNGVPKFEVERWRADLNAATGCLIERRRGKVISLTDSGILVGRRPYLRLPARVTVFNFLEHL